MIWLPITVTICAVLWVLEKYVEAVAGDLVAGLGFWVHAAAALIVSLASWALWGVLT